MTTQPGALETAFRDQAEGGAVLGVDMEPAQLDLLRDPATGRLPADAYQRARSMPAERRGPGRPAGAKGKRSKKLAQLVCQGHGDPVLFMASVYSRPLDQLVELLQIADGSAAHTERMLGLCDEVTAFMRTTGSMALALEPKRLERLADLLDRVVDMAGALKTKPGELAVKALAAQINAAKEVGPYVHGKQPISVEVRGKADMVLLIPGLNAPLGIDTQHLSQAIEHQGLGAFDPETLQMIPAPEGSFDEEDEDDER